MTTQRVRKAVFPVAGLGTRFLPATKAMPKEMLPVVDKPLIQYAVEEAAAAGIEQMIFVTGRGKRAIEDHFDRAPELEQTLDAQRKHELLELLLSATPPGVSFVYVRQPEPLGLGHAVLCAEQVVGDEPFAVILADDLIDAAPGVTAQLVESYRRTGASVLAVEDVPREDTRKYGIVATEPMNKLEERVTRIVEKPKPQEAPSTLAVVGRYVLRPEIFIELANTPRGAGGEIQLTDAIARRVARGEVIARRFEGKRYDCGSKQGFLRANIAYGRRAGLLTV
ncbi:MAG TPA: UTP--glucose-1-phosphate uridylyltransferase GalU [Burkholderiaceae bacterium]|nr:UTP--glucose-1-phosphate uridylyltransferase GalU [Burkholderiaceae bacterium]